MCFRSCKYSVYIGLQAGMCLAYKSLLYGKQDSRGTPSFAFAILTTPEPIMRLHPEMPEKEMHVLTLNRAEAAFSIKQKLTWALQD